MDKKLLEINVGHELEIKTDYNYSNKPFEIGELISFLESAKKQGATHVCISGQCEYDNTSNLENCNIKPIFIREETVEEFDLRAKQEDELKLKRQAYHDEIDRQKYEELKKKFESK